MKIYKRPCHSDIFRVPVICSFLLFAWHVFIIYFGKLIFFSLHSLIYSASLSCCWHDHISVHIVMHVLQVSIPSQRRYVGYWADILSFPKGVGHSPPNVSLPHPCSRELRRIRLYDMVNTDAVFFVVSELQEVIHPRRFPSTSASLIEFGFSYAKLKSYCLVQNLL